MKYRKFESDDAGLDIFGEQKPYQSRNITIFFAIFHGDNVVILSYSC